MSDQEALRDEIAELWNEHQIAWSPRGNVCTCGWTGVDDDRHFAGAVLPVVEREIRALTDRVNAEAQELAQKAATEVSVGDYADGRRAAWSDGAQRLRALVAPQTRNSNERLRVRTQRAALGPSSQPKESHNDRRGAAGDSDDH